MGKVFIDCDLSRPLPPSHCWLSSVSSAYKEER